MLPRMDGSRHRLRRRFWPCLGLLSALSLASCEAVPFYEKGVLSSALMTFDENAPDDHSQQKVFYSREGSTGGIGSKAGGGCGCTN